MGDYYYRLVRFTAGTKKRNSYCPFKSLLDLTYHYEIPKNMEHAISIMPLTDDPTIWQWVVVAANLKMEKDHNICKAFEQCYYKDPKKSRIIINKDPNEWFTQNENSKLMGLLHFQDGVFPYKYQQNMLIGTKFDQITLDRYTFVVYDKFTQLSSDERFKGSADLFIKNDKFSRLEPTEIQMHPIETNVLIGLKTKNYENLEKKGIMNMPYTWSASTFQNLKHDYGIWAEYLKPIFLWWYPHMTWGPFYWNWRTFLGSVETDFYVNKSFYDPNGDAVQKGTSSRPWRVQFESFYQHL